MTDREQIIAAAREAGLGYFKIKCSDKTSVDALERFYAIAFKAGRQAERESINQDDGTIDWREENEV